MPHRVANFLRTSSGNITNITKPSSRSTSRNTSRTNSPYTSDGEDHSVAPAVRMHDLADAVKKHHILSLPFGRSSKDVKEVKENPAFSSVGIDWSVESPPIVFHGNPEESTGALVSGQMFLDVKDDVVEVDGFSATLSMNITQKRPYHSNCADCQVHTTELKTWVFLGHPTTLYRGKHPFPFSVLLEGRLPASLETPIVTISYDFKAVAAVTRNPGTSTSSCVPAKFERRLNVKRSLTEPLYPHHSVRVFPPTNIKASAHFGSVIHPSGANKMTLKLDGLISHNEKVKTIDLWKLKKVTWKLEETIKTVASACDKHAPADAEAEGSASHTRTETRMLGEKSLHDGWKSDFTGTDGTVDFEFEYALNAGKPNAREPKYACDTKAPNGTQVSHALLLELVVSKEYAPEGKPQQANQTGTGRILRMHFGVNLTEFPGMGVSWDNEAPPIYEDVPPSPPGYPTEPPIEYDDLEALDAQRSLSQPVSRRNSDS